uniref:Tr-type G domain-containing protein n=1 Tax=Ciona savignyi TaxID=51511 RepID=H2YE00_CIOSA
SKIRNIGIMAHIDAGKTTTTERMLFYSGYINKMGDIDSGNTVMDYLPTEIERGITVQSAAISFNWDNTQINLIDTPGHVDFTIEVERALRVLDGAVAIFDGSRGVEAQSRMVWLQADGHNIPRLAYINKMDKTEANFAASVDSLKRQLKANTLILQLPVFQANQFVGVIDLITMERIEWDMQVVSPNQNGRNCTIHKLTNKDKEWETSLSAKSSIIEQLADKFDEVAIQWLEGEYAGDAELFPSTELKKWIRHGTIDRTFVPVLCGSSYKNVGIQPLLNAVVDYLPQPSDIQHPFLRYYDNTLLAMAFKVLHDKRLGSIIFVRVYSGTLESGRKLYNVNKGKEEKVLRLMTVYADEYKDTKVIKAGNIGVISGFQSTVTGDTLLESKQALEAAVAKANLISKDTVDNKTDNSPVVLTAVRIPEPVFFCSVEVYSPTQEKGNILGYPVMGADVRILTARAKRGCPSGLITASAVKCTREALDKASCDLLEPMMQIEISTRGENLMQKILGDLAKRHAKISDISTTDNDGNMKILAEAPVSEMKGYASSLRSSTSGNADLSLHPSGYKVVTQERKLQLKRKISGT